MIRFMNSSEPRTMRRNFLSALVIVFACMALAARIGAEQEVAGRKPAPRSSAT